MNSQAPQKKIAWVYFLELTLVFWMGYLVFSLQVFVLAPKVSLIGDGRAYFLTAQHCLNALSRGNVYDIFHYVLGGCQNELERTAIVSHMPGTLTLLKSGPILPCFLLIVYALTGRSMILANWHLAAASMITLTALTICGIWAWSRSLGGPIAGRIAFLLAITYSGFICNAGRILLEIPAMTLVVFAMYSWHIFLKTQARYESSSDIQIENGATSVRALHRAYQSKLLCLAFLAGLLTGLLALSRPTFLPWPFLMTFCLLIYSFVSRHNNRRIFTLGITLSILLGVLVSFIPWAVTQKVLSGKATLVVDRYGPLNLSRGMNLQTDGFDSMPGIWVIHPETFEETTGQVLQQLSKQIKERPAAIFHLLVRKPARLIDSPWNDFQTRALGIPFLLQRFLHQFILLAAILGIVMLLEHGRKRQHFALLLSGLLIGVFLSYHLVSCFFITMSRYFVTAMPAAIVAASYFLAQLYARGKEAWQSLAAVILAPTISFALYYLLVPGYGRLSDLSSDFGLAQLSLTAAFILSSALTFGLLLPAFTVFRGTRSKFLLCSFALISGFCCFVSVGYQYMCSEAVVRLGSIDHRRLLSKVTLPAANNSTTWFLLIDANDAKDNSTEAQEHAQAEGILSDMQINLNGRELKADWLPFIALDNSLREEFLALAVHAYSSQKRFSDLRQWRATALPAENLVSPGDNTIEFSLRDKESSHPKFFADFADSLGKRIHTVSLLRFSWTKGFYAGLPGEMRLDEWPDNTDRTFDIFTLGGQASKIKPRIFLVGIRTEVQSASWTRSIKLTDQKIDPSAEHCISTLEIKPVPGLAELGGHGQSLRIRVSGQLRSSEPEDTASVCMLENYTKGAINADEYAALAPQSLIASNNEWKDFAFEDIVDPSQTINFPDSNSSSASSSTKLTSLQLQFMHMPWGEAFSYGVTARKGLVQFRNLKLEVFGQPRIDLSKQEAHFYELESQFELAR